MGLFSHFRRMTRSRAFPGAKTLESSKFRAGPSDLVIDISHASRDAVDSAGRRKGRAPQPCLAHPLAMRPKLPGLCRRGGCDSRIELALALLMVLVGRDALVPENGRHPHIRMRDGPDAAFLADAIRTEIIAKAGICRFEIVPLLRRPSMRRDEESVLDRVARDAGLSGRGARTGRACGVAPVGLDATRT